MTFETGYRALGRGLKSAWTNAGVVVVAGVLLWHTGRLLWDERGAWSCGMG